MLRLDSGNVNETKDEKFIEDDGNYHQKMSFFPVMRTFDDNFFFLLLRNFFFFEKTYKVCDLFSLVREMKKVFIAVSAELHLIFIS